MFLLAFLTTFVMPFGLHSMLPSLSFLQQMVSSETPFVAVVETGGDVESFSVRDNIERPVAFGPDGSSYSVASSYYLQKVAPDGATSYILIHAPTQSHATENGAIVYAAGYLWFQAFEGYIHMKPDGTNTTYHQQGFGAPFAAAPNGVYVTLGTGLEFIDGTTFKRTLYPIVYGNVLQYYSVGAITLGKNGLLYFTFRPNGSTIQHLARLDADGTIAVFGPKNVCGKSTYDTISNRALVAYSDGIYFVGDDGTGSSLCRTTYTGFFTRLTPPFRYAGSLRPHSAIRLGAGIDGDNDGNIWATNVIGAGLYSYNTHTSQAAGPYRPDILQFLSAPIVGPDQNVWLYGLFAGNQAFYGAYVRHLETFIPTSVNLSFVGQSIDFYVSEPVKSAPWTAYSMDPAVATVGPGSYRLGKFKVTAVSTGSTAIVVTDAYGNIRKEPVTVTSS